MNDTAVTSGRTEKSTAAAIPAIAVHPALKKHHRPSGRLSHFDGSQSDLIARVEQALQSQTTPRKVGRIPGSLIVEINPAGVYCKVNEDARTRDGFEKPEAVRAEVVLHSKELVMPANGRHHGRLYRLTRQEGAQYFVVAVHGWLSPGHRSGHT